ncbi:alpha-amylase family glycosyl hydrolase [Rhodohalobacter mucosus]|uniref:alpha-amylase family glycosyl hydrolase n=1 Tax=Rhodohalobacter mucosus TaxID=2079485 RepID=UPI0013048497|nr:alpha-amylase family glycosyl hydrolase [Rhodohalobacter mucosus]
MSPLLYLIFLLVPASAFSQAISSDPSFPTEDGPITIIFDASQADRDDLVDFQGDVYAHTGVIVSEADIGSGNWSYVKSNWGENLPELQMSSTGENIWELQIDDIREFYSVPESVDRIYQLAFVFRSADTNLQSENLYVDINNNSIAVQFSSPSVSGLNPYFAELSEVIEFEIEGTSPSGTLQSITLFQDGSEIASSSGSDFLSYSYTVTDQGRKDFVALAVDSEGQEARDSLYIVINPPVTVLSRPAGVEDGITYHEGGTSATLSVYAPGKDFVYLIGDFSGWEVREEYFMNLDSSAPEGQRFWITLDNLTPGETYRYQYLVDGEIRVADLYSELVIDPFFDRFIPETIYPDLPVYPAGLTEHTVSVLEPGRDEYVWQVTDFERPPKEELIIYELLVRDFLEEQSFQVLADTLGYLERLGVNAIELMPVSQFDGNISWGYNPTFHGALDKSYGTRRAFKQFVDEAHSRGIAVLLDVVYNHAHDRSPLIRMFGQSRGSDFANGNPLLGPGHAYNVFFHLNHDHPYIQYWVDRMNRYWLETYNIDGYRFDLSKGFASNVDDRSLLDGENPQRISNLKRMYDEIRTYDQDAYIILEHFAAGSEERQLEQHGMMLWGNHNFNYSEGVMGYNEGIKSNMSGIYFGNRNFQNPHLVGYMESHDEQWLMHKAAEFGNDTNQDHNVKDLDTALQRMKLAGAFFFTIPGPKMLWQFGELGYGWAPGECLKPGGSGDGDCRATDPGRTDPKPIRWEYYDEENRNRLYRSWGELTRLRRSSPVFSSADTDFSSSLSGDTKWIRLSHSDMDALVIGNFGVTFNQLTVDFSAAGTWNDFVTGESIEVDNTLEQTFTLSPGEFRIFTSREIEPAESNVFFKPGESQFATLPNDFIIEPNFPNPFNPGTTIRYVVPEESPVRIDVYDILGRRVSTLVNNDLHPRGQFTINFDGSDLSSGVYITRMVGGGGSSVQKMTLIK